MSSDLEILKKEGQNLNKLHKNAEEIKGLAKLIEKRVAESITEEIRKRDITQKVEIKGKPEVRVTFPDMQMVKGKMQIIGPIEAKVVFPDIQKIGGTVKAKLDYEKLREVFEEVLEKFESPELQKISGEVLAKVTFPDVQKVSGKVDTNIPVASGQKPSLQANPTVYVPVRLTNGKQFYEAIAGIAEAGRATASYADNGGVPKTVVIGQHSMKESIPVVISSDQGPLTVSGNLSVIFPEPLPVIPQGITTISGNVLATINTPNGPFAVTIANPTLTVIQNGPVTISGTVTPAVFGLGDGKVNANMLPGDGSTPAGQNAQLIAGAGYTLPQISLSASNQNSNWIDMINYPWIAIQITTNTTPATLTFQTAGDPSESNPQNLTLLQSSSNTPGSTTTSATGLFHGPRAGRWIRIASNLAGNNTATMIVTLFTTASAWHAFLATQNGTWTVGANSPTGSAVPANAFFIGIQSSGGGNLRGVVEAPALGDNSGAAGAVATAGWIYNNSGYDRKRNNYNTTTGDAPTIVSATTTNGAAQTNYNARGAIITTILGTVSGTVPALQLQLQWSPDGGTTWLNYGSATTSLTVSTGNTISIAVYPTTLTAALLGTTNTSDNTQINAPLPRTWRLQYISTGTGISIAVASVQVNYIL